MTSDKRVSSLVVVLGQVPGVAAGLAFDIAKRPTPTRVSDVLNSTLPVLPQLSDSVRQNARMSVADVESRPVPTINTSGEVWRADFPGLGSLTIDSTGAVTVAPEEIIVLQPPPTQWWDDLDETGCFPGHWESTVARERALRWGWGEQLSRVRRGHRLTRSTTVVDQAGRGLAIVGTVHDQAILTVGLLRQGWRLLADQPTAMDWSGDQLVASPSAAPLVVAISLLRKTFPTGLPDAWSGAPARGNSNSVALEVPRWTEPAPVVAIVSAEMGRAGSTEHWEIVRGHRRFVLATTLFINSGPLAGGDDSTGGLAEKARIAQLPAAVVRTDARSSAPGLPSLVRWWEGLS